ncbi:MAG TPA: efflux RND transporter periplasmic adaptor subunit [Candidatus Binataceae bacterium]|nr:efflux RND transporter periplasmic adaptor subunit [Candidatus Binataceae bacterium]
MDSETSRPAAIRRHGARYALGWIVAALVVLGVVAGLVYARQVRISDQTTQLEAGLQQGPRVLVQRAVAGPGSRDLDLPATVRGYIETPVYAKIPGYLKSIRVDKGDRVKAGEVLAVLESPETDKQVADARANYWLQRITDRRDRELVKASVIAQQAADDQHSLMLQAKAAYQQILATQAYEIIRAPVSGLVTARYVDPGKLIPQVTAPTTATPIVTIATLQPVRIYAYVPQDVAPLVHDSDPATVTVPAYPGRKFEGRITRHPEALDPNNLTMLVEVDLPNRDQALFPGMYARLQIHVAIPPGVPMVPDDTLIFRDNRVYVPVVRNERLHFVPVTLGNDNGYTVEVTKGIKAGELVALNVGGSARDGERVQPMPANGGQSPAARTTVTTKRAH